MLIVCHVNDFRGRAGDGSNAPSPVGLDVDGSPVPLGSKATHNPIGISKSPWARQEPMKPCHNETKTHRAIRFEETAPGALGSMLASLTNNPLISVSWSMFTTLLFQPFHPGARLAPWLRKKCWGQHWLWKVFS